MIPPYPLPPQRGFQARKNNISEASSNPFLLAQDLAQTKFSKYFKGHDSRHEIYTDNVPHSPLLDDDTSVYSTYPRLTMRPASVKSTIASVNEGPKPESEQKTSKPDSVLQADCQTLRVSIDRVRPGKPDSGYETDTSSQVNSWPQDSIITPLDLLAPVNATISAVVESLWIVENYYLLLCLHPGPTPVQSHYRKVFRVQAIRS